MSETYHRSLDGLRAVAVGIVMLAHAGFPYPRSGGVGVDVFFVLSGFLITGLLSRELQQHGRIDLLHFYIRRLLRLAPALLLVTVVYAAMQWVFTGAFPGIELAVILSYTANWARALFDVDLADMGHVWSLAIEEQYYLLWPAVVLLIGLKLGSARTRFHWLLLLALALAVYRWAMVDRYSAERIYFGLDTHMDGLVLGSALSYFLQAQGERGLSERSSRWLGRLLVPVAIVTLLLVMKLIRWQDPEMGQYGFAVVALAAAALIADLVAGRHSLIRAALSHPVMVHAGKISYGLYLWHYPLYGLLGHYTEDLRFMFAAPLKIAVSVAVAALSYQLIERRFLELKSRFAPRRPTPVPNFNPAI